MIHPAEPSVTMRDLPQQIAESERNNKRSTFTERVPYQPSASFDPFVQLGGQPLSTIYDHTPKRLPTASACLVSVTQKQDMAVL